MRIVFMGTPDFAVASLDALIKSGNEVVAVVTATDKPAGRGKKIQMSAVKQYALDNEIQTILQPEKLKNIDFIQSLKEINADLFVVVAFRMLPEVVWSMPSKGTINVHASLLPNYRGAAPINWAVINGETATGVSTFFIEKEIDTGKVIMQKSVEIGEYDTAGIVHDKLMHAGADLLVETVKLVNNNSYTSVDQNELLKHSKKITPAPKIFKKDCAIDWSKTSREIFNKIRGLSPYPAAFATLKSDKEISVKIYESDYELVAHNNQNGSIFTDNKSFIKVSVSDGYIELKEIQIAGKKRMDVESFLRGTKLSKDSHFI